MNQSDKQKRCRSLNWDEEEKLLFRTVLKEYAHIIENKSLDTNSNKKKTEAWDEIHKKFNELNGRQRQLNQLKIQWKTMKINVRKSCSSFRNEINKTGGGTRPATPDDSVLQIKDLLNPAELLKDHNIYDSDGIIPNSLETKDILTKTTETSIVDHQGSCSDTCSITLQDTKPITYVIKALETNYDNNNTNHDSQQTADICIETIKDVDAQAEYTPLVISQDNDVIVATPHNKKIGTSTAKKVPKRRINISNNSLKSRKDHEDYVSSLISHSKILKDEEHRRRMEMAEEEHLLNIQIKKEKLRSAILEREILEIKKANENNSKSSQ